MAEESPEITSGKMSRFRCKQAAGGKLRDSPLRLMGRNLKLQSGSSFLFQNSPPLFLTSAPLLRFSRLFSLSPALNLSFLLPGCVLSSFPVLFLALGTSPVGCLYLSGTFLAFFFSLHPQNFSRFSAVINTLSPPLDPFSFQGFL